MATRLPMDGAILLRKRLVDVGRALNPLPPEEQLLGYLNKLEDLLRRVVQRAHMDEQSEKLMVTVLQPAMSALVTEKILNHPNLDVSFAVTACLSEITRITAPFVPYDDNVLKVVLRRIVDCFELLGETTSPFYKRSRRIFWTFVKLHVHRILLHEDLECHELILQLFRYFLKKEQESSEVDLCTMFDIMATMLEEMKEVPLSLAMCLLARLTKEEEKTASPSFTVYAEFLMERCHEKLKPAMKELLDGAKIFLYGNVVTKYFADIFVNNPNDGGKGIAASDQFDLEEEGMSKNEAMDDTVASTEEDEAPLPPTDAELSLAAGTKEELPPIAGAKEEELPPGEIWYSKYYVTRVKYGEELPRSLSVYAKISLNF